MKAKRWQVVALTATLLAATVNVNAATEIPEDEDGPTFGTTALDVVAGKPLGVAAVVGGAALWVVGLPFSILGQNVEQSAQTLIGEPAQALTRCLGCTPAQDATYKAGLNDKQEVRLVVDQPSVIIITTDDKVVVYPR